MAVARQDRAGWCSVFVWPSLAPVKDMEVFLLGKSMCDPVFVKALHTVLRLMIDELHVKTFNVAIFGMELVQDTTGEASDASLHAAVEIPTKAGEAANAGPDLLPHRPVVARCFVPSPAACTLIPDSGVAGPKNLSGLLCLSGRSVQDCVKRKAEQQSIRFWSAGGSCWGIDRAHRPIHIACGNTRKAASANLDTHSS